MIGLDLTELRGAAIFALAFPLSVSGVGIVTRVFYMILTGKGVNASKVRDSAEERRERQWLLWPLVVSFLVIVVFIVAAFLNGDGYWFALRDGYWFASRGTSETPRTHTNEIRRTIRKDAGFVWTLQSRAPHSRVMSDNRLSDAVGLSSDTHVASVLDVTQSSGLPVLGESPAGGGWLWAEI